VPPILALFLTIGFIVYSFRRDNRESPNTSSALWLPFLWVTISGSRFVSEWLAIIGLSGGGSTIEEGSPIDAIFFFAIIFLGVRVLLRRNVSLQSFVQQNRWVAIYLGYCLLSVIWSEYPLVAFKRWIKIFGQPVMVLVILTEPNPIESLRKVFKRAIFILIPLSVTFIKYFPEFSRGYDSWSGFATNTGVTTNKNTLGVFCMVSGLVFFWDALQIIQDKRGKDRWKDLIFVTIYFCLIIWTLSMAQSATSLATMVLGMAIILLLGRPWVNPRKIGTYLLIIVPVLLVLHFGVGFTDFIYELLGRNTTLTGRTEIWEKLLSTHENPILGYGFESFWLGDRRWGLARSMGFIFELNSAHNGYLETYMNLGVVGLILTCAMILSAFRKCQRDLLVNFNFARFRIAYLIAFLIYNWTEAGFRTHVPHFFLFFAIAIDYSNGSEGTNAVNARNRIN